MGVLVRIPKESPEEIEATRRKIAEVGSEIAYYQKLKKKAPTERVVKSTEEGISDLTFEKNSLGQVLEAQRAGYKRVTFERDSHKTAGFVEDPRCFKHPDRTAIFIALGALLFQALFTLWLASLLDGLVGDFSTTVGLMLSMIFSCFVFILVVAVIARVNKARVTAAGMPDFSAHFLQTPLPEEARKAYQEAKKSGLFGSPIQVWAPYKAFDGVLKEGRMVLFTKRGGETFVIAEVVLESGVEFSPVLFQGART